MTVRPSILALALVLSSSTALADVLPPPMPITCPAGAREGTGHCGTVCYPVQCESAADCQEGEACEARPLCLEDVTCGGWGGSTTIVHGACPSGSCADGSCRSIRTCGPRASAPGDAGAGGREHVTWGCGCRGAGARTSLAWGAPLVLALLGARRLRRGGRP